MRGLKMKVLQPIDSPAFAVTIRPLPPSHDDDTAALRTTAQNRIWI